MSKLVPHVINGSTSATKIVEAGAVGVKLLNNHSAAPQYATLPQNPLITTRVAGGEYFVNYNVDPIQSAIAYFDTLLKDIVINNPYVTAFEGPNEIVCNDPVQMDWYAKFEAHRTNLLGTYGKRSIVGNFSTGSPGNLNLWQYFRPAIDPAKLRNGFLGLHEYSEPERFYSGDRWYFCRYRLAPRDIPKLITECGMDSIPAVYDSNGTLLYQAGQPWKQYKWRDGTNITAQEYFDLMVAYDNELKKDNDVFFAAIFTFGDTWPSHNVENTEFPFLMENYIRNDNMKTQYVVTAKLLNVREFPWTGSLIPPVIAQVTQGTMLTVYDVVKFGSMSNGWALISPNGNQWVNMYYLA